jgi:NAD(P)-dependent dehydrogenase (short-subunit alcohol dehydrogenase family)
MISGANRGIGRVIAEKLLNEGYLLSLGVRNPEQFLGLFDSLFHYKYDARDKNSAKLWIDATIRQFGRIDCLINNAGVFYELSFEDDEEDLLDDMWEVNAKAPLRLSRLAFPYLRESGSGRIIDIISMSGKRVRHNNIGYSMSKYAAQAASLTARKVGWNDGIRITSICTAYVKTDMSAKSSFPQNEMSRPEDIAQVVSSILLLPNESSIHEIMMNCTFEEF